VCRLLKSASGLPQGGILGPLLFLIFINDLPKCLQGSTGLLFADDFKIFRQIGNDADRSILQGDLDEVARWFYNNNMTLNIKKCFIPFPNVC